jgi:hypothetical protein
MRRYSEAVKADVRRRMGPPHRQSVAEISKELGIHVITLYKWRKAWRLQGEVVPASQKDPEGWGPADKFTVVLETEPYAIFDGRSINHHCSHMFIDRCVDIVSCSNVGYGKSLQLVVLANAWNRLSKSPMAWQWRVRWAVSRPRH